MSKPWVGERKKVRLNERLRHGLRPRLDAGCIKSCDACVTGTHCGVRSLSTLGYDLDESNKLDDLQEPKETLLDTQTVKIHGW